MLPPETIQERRHLMASKGDLFRRRIDDPRYPVHVPATIEASGMAGAPQSGEIVDLSRGGLALEFFGALDPGAPVRVTLHLHDQVALTILGRVAWATRAFRAGYGSAGVAFKDGLNEDFVADLASETSPA
jgi:PilZ domain-containing protein